MTQISEFSFDNLEVTTKKCLYISDNNPMIRNKKLYRISDIINNNEYKNLYIEESMKNAKDYNDFSPVYIDLGIIYYNTGITIDGWTTLNQLHSRFEKAINITLDDVLSNIRNARNNNQFINVADIKLIELAGASKKEVQDLVNYRQEWYNRKEREEQAEREERKRKDQEFVQEQNKKVEELVLAAEQAILNKQEVKNKDITVYKDRYDNNDMSLILYMMKQNNIKVPLKTQGWINQALVSIDYSKEWGDYSNYRYYKTFANSTVFGKYLEQLVKAIQEKYGVKEEKVYDPELDRLFNFSGYKG